mmetsp:Transcript_4526/g.7578  ORF Transcript_4526/g.7578 Transcript_4526/m.7578 type:complete len:325 (-) Transcript_4526:123-1097(-)
MLWKGIFQLHAHFFGNDGTSRQDSNVLHGSLAVVTKARGLDGTHLDSSTELVHDKGSQCFGLHVFRNNQERSLALDNRFQNGNQLCEAAHLLFNQENMRVLEFNFLSLGVSDKVRTDESSFKSHTLDNFQFVLHSLSILNGNDTLLSDTLHGVGNKVTNFYIRVGRDGTHLRDLFLAGDWTRNILQRIHDRSHGQLNTSAQIHGIHTGSDSLATFAVDSTRQNSGSGGSISRYIIGFTRHTLDELGAHIFKLVLEINRFGDSDAILGNLRSSVWLTDNGIAALGTQSDLHSIGQEVDSSQHGSSSFDTKLDLLTHHSLARHLGS